MILISHHWGSWSAFSILQL